MRWTISNSFDQMSVFGFLFAFQLAYDTNGVHEGASLWLLHFFLRCPITAALKAPFALRSKPRKWQKEYTVTLNCERVNHLFEKDETDVLIAERDVDIIQHSAFE